MNNKGRSLSFKLRDGTAVKEDLPFEKFLKYGPQALTDSELLAIIVRCGTKDHDPMQIGQQILTRCRQYETGIGGLYQLSVDELMKIDGLGQVKAVQIKCIAELSLRISRSRKSDVVTFQSSEDIARYYMEQLRHLPRERVILLLLDNRLRLIREVLISVGTASASVLPSPSPHPRSARYPSTARSSFMAVIWEMSVSERRDFSFTRIRATAKI